jgi:hypothetical protein
MAEGLIEELLSISDSVSMTIGLYTGKLVRNETRVYFIAERFSGWEIIQECAQEDIVTVERIENFMGVRFEIGLPGNRWVCKDVAEDADLSSLLGVELTKPSVSRAKVLSDDSSESVGLADVVPLKTVVQDVEIQDVEIQEIERHTAQQTTEPIQFEPEVQPQKTSDINQPISEDASSISRTEVVQIRKYIQSKPSTWDTICLLLGTDAPSDLNIQEDAQLEDFIQKNPGLFEAFSNRLVTEEDGSINVVQQNFLERILNFEGESDSGQALKVVGVVILLMLFLPSDILWSLIRVLISLAF